MLLIKRSSKKRRKKKREDPSSSSSSTPSSSAKTTSKRKSPSKSTSTSSEQQTKRIKSATDTDTNSNTTKLPPPISLADLTRKCATARFSDFDLSEWLVKSCTSLNMTRPTPVQLKCLPPILAGRNCVACAETGSGKTAAFALPILERLSRDPYGVFAIVLTPTRELAMQIADQFNALGASMRVRVSTIIGGLSAMRQSLEIQRRPHVIVATPGRLAAHIESASPPHLKSLRFLVLDEADRLLEGSGFKEDIRTIVDACPSAKRRQTLLFSATMDNQNVRRTALGDSTSVPDPFVFDISSRVAVPETLAQTYVFVPAKVKAAYLFHALMQGFRSKPEDEGEDGGGEFPRIKSCIVFCATCDMCQLLAETSLELEIPAVCLHSRLSQSRRIASLAKFKSGQVRLLFATDVASRGLDIPRVELVTNFDVPKTPKDYVHRIGRAARAGRSGSALTVITQHDIELVQSIEAYTETKMVDFVALSSAESEVLKILQRVSTATRLARMRIAQDDWKG